MILREPIDARSAANIKPNTTKIKALHDEEWNGDEKARKMVYYFTSNVVTPSAQIYAGKDKVESALFPQPHISQSHKSQTRIL